MSQFDSLIIGEVAQDTNVDYDGTTVHAVGGAVYYSGFAAANTGHKTAVLPKADTAQVDLAAAFAPAPNVTVYPLHSRTSFVTKNVYHTPDRERRTSTVDSVIEPYRTEEVPDIDAAIWHLAGLAAGDIPNEMIPFAARHAMVAIDVQTMLRWVENGGMVYHDWAEKKEHPSPADRRKSYRPARWADPVRPAWAPIPACPRCNRSWCRQTGCRCTGASARLARGYNKNPLCRGRPGPASSGRSPRSLPALRRQGHPRPVQIFRRRRPTYRGWRRFSFLHGAASNSSRLFPGNTGSSAKNP